MKKQTLFIVFMLFSVCAVYSRPIDKATALRSADAFFQKKQLAQTNKAPSVAAKPLLTYKATDSVTATDYFYVYTMGNNEGFVIVAADTRVQPILGYSPTGSFRIDQAPDNLKSWLAEYENQIKYAIEHLPDVEPATGGSARLKMPAAVVAPLLGAIKWNQGKPYNNLCPMDGTKRSVTGCVATAMAQLMYYHRHPEQGTGSKTYTTEKLGQELTADFGATTYNWAKMLPAYSSSATDEENTAVATLMYHAGVSVSMDYSSGGSGGSTSMVPLALNTYFGYDIGMQMCDRIYYTAAGWRAKIKAELDAARPVFYAGYNATAGHAFLCDGYDSDNLFHINWGWGGYSDGYFELSALNNHLLRRWI